MSARIKILTLAGCFAAVALAVAVHVPAALDVEGDGWLLTLAFLPCVFILIDLIDAMVRVIARRRHRQAAAFAPANVGFALRAAPHAFVYAVRNIESHLDEFLTRRAEQRDATWIVDLGSDDHTVLRLRAAGWRCLEIVGRPGKRAALERLLRDLPAPIATVIVLDDASVLATAVRDPASFERCLRDFQRSGAAAMAPRVSMQGDRLADRMLHLESVLDFGLTRSALGDLATIEGPCIYRRDALQSLLAGPVRAPQAPDLDDTLVALARGERVYCEPRLEVLCATPATFEAWLRARAAEWRGTAVAFWKRRTEIDALAKRGPLALYHYVFHSGLMHLFATPLRLVSAAVVHASFANGVDELAGSSLVPDGIVTEPAVFALVYLKYLLLHVFMIFAAAERREVPGLLALAPLYFFHTQLRGLPVLAWLSGARMPGESRAHEVARA